MATVLRNCKMNLELSTDFFEDIFLTKIRFKRDADEHSIYI